MNVVEALSTRYTTRAFKPDPIDRTTLEKVMEAALRSPSWANTQPWEIYVAGGEVLNRLREAYLTNLKNCVTRNPDLAVPKEWPARVPETDGGLEVRTHGDPRAGLPRQVGTQGPVGNELSFLSRADRRVYLHGQDAHPVVDLRPRSFFPEPHAGGASLRHSTRPRQ